MYFHIARSREEFQILVERNSHHAVGRIECFLNSIAMVDINVNVQNTSILPMDYAMSPDRTLITREWLRHYRSHNKNQKLRISWHGEDRLTS